MTPIEGPEDEIFEQALALTSPAERRAFLDRVTANDSALRRRVEELLECHQVAGDFNFLPGAARPSAAPDLDPSFSEESGGRIGRYQLLERIGEGGFGVVYRAEQREPMVREVALKILKLGMDTREVIARFEAERQALALMDHPNIARVFDAGATRSGRPYFVMERVDGVPITRFCDQRQLDTGARLRLFIEVCAAVQHAHQKGIIHRDLKPSNILVALQDGQPVPKVIDFGIAKATEPSLTDRTAFTQGQQLLGTPAYMSPEQAPGSGLDVDTRSDIYSLGVVLYELLTGSPPFDPKELQGAGWEDMRRILRERSPLRPSTQLSRRHPAARPKGRAASAARVAPPALAADLDWIVLKALEKDRARRYATANALAADLGRHLRNEPVSAVPPSRSYLLSKYVRRHRVALSGFAFLALVLILSASFSLWKANQALVARKDADAARAKAEESAALATRERNRARLQSSQSDRQLADQLLRQNQVPKALLYLARSLGSDPANRATFKRLMSTLTQRHMALRTEWSAKLDGRAIDGHFNSDGTRLVVVNDDLTLSFLDTLTGGQVRSQDRLERLDHGVQVRFTHDGTRAVTLEVDGGNFRVWDLGTGRLAAPGFRHAPAGLHFALTPDDRLIVSSGGDSRIRFWDPKTGMERFGPIALEMPQKIFALAAQGSKLLVAQGYRSILQTWDLSPDTPPTLSPQQLPFSPGVQNIVLLDAISPKGDTLIVNQRRREGTPRPAATPEPGSTLDTFRPSLSAWDIISGTMRWKNESMREEIAGIAWSADETRLLVAALSGDLEIRSGLNGNLVQPLPLKKPSGYREGVPGQTWIGQDDATSRIFFLGHETGQEIMPSVETGASAMEWAVDTNHRRVRTYVPNQADGLEHWDYAGSSALAYPLLTNVPGRFADILPDWSASVWINDDGELVMIDPASGQRLAPAEAEPIGIAEARFTENGTRLLTLTTDRRSMACREWPGLRPVSRFAFAPPGHLGNWAMNDDASTVAFTVDAPGEWNYPGTKQVHLWNPAANTAPTVLDSFDGNYIDIAVSPDGTWVFLALRQAEAVLYRKEVDWQKLALLGSERFSSGTFSHDGRWLALVSPQSGARIYDLATRQFSGRSLPNTDFGEITQVRFSNDDGLLMVTGLRKPPARIGDVAIQSDRLPAEAGVLWDWRAGEIASDPLALDGRNPRRFSPDGNRFLLVSEAGPEVLDLAPAAESAPEWFHRFVRGYCGYQFDRAGRVERTPPPPFDSLREWVGHLTRDEPGTPLARWCRWLVADRTQRSISPETTLTLPEQVERLLFSQREADIQEAWRLAPLEARTMARMSASLLDRENPSDLRRADWLMEEAFRIDPDSPDAWFAKASSLARQGNAAEALKAVETTLAKQAGDWAYHRLRARLLARLDRPDEAVAAVDQATVLLARLQDGRDRLDLDDLRFAKIGLLRRLGRLKEVRSTQDQLFRVPARDASLPATLIDLTDFYNAGLSRDWHGHPGGNLSMLAPGRHVLRGVPFDIRGIVQLQCDLMLHHPRHTVLTNQYPRRVDGISIGQEAARIHFLQAALFGNSTFAPKGTPVVSYLIHYADGGQCEVELKLGEQTRDWWIGKPANAPAFSPESGLELAWQGYIDSGNVGLFKTTWENPRPSVRVESIDLVSAMNTPGPFVVAITVEESRAPADALKPSGAFPPSRVATRPP